MMKTSTMDNNGKLRSLLRWFDAYAGTSTSAQEPVQKIEWLRALPFIAMHLAVLCVAFVGWSPVAVLVAVLLYVLRMFAITGFYHRYFSHKAFRTSRLLQFIFAAVAASAVQRGPLWWASHHRLHHANSDKPDDEHSPLQRGFLWSHMGWFLSARNFAAHLDRVKDFARYPELRFLDRFDVLMPVVLAVSLFALGELLNHVSPALGTDGWQMLVWGFVISTVVLYHVTFTINSIAHRTGNRAFPTRDNSRNNFVLALLTFGEGWHNNHHYYPGSARQGFAWWEVDFTYYLLRLMETLGLVWDLRPVPQRVLQQHQNSRIQTKKRGSV